MGRNKLPPGELIKQVKLSVKAKNIQKLGGEKKVQEIAYKAIERALKNL